ncbi:hypothetical protein GPDM_15079 [Planococcus donghaensis MPA1U2]|uniref:Uncharacterized protein n=1 Tax=Planococcus donghaensis MPA1U2 TaxID=933115 RepID=E7RKJ1_9BACL|nr:hypothetical protein [Planococcus donghaensis]EGA88421.1 hypothetical protein GPDM_15079 [Planococcus donghaensis MPA1U2]
MQDDVESNLFKRGYELAWVRKYNGPELILLIMATFFPILILWENSLIYILYFVSFVSIVLTIKDHNVKTSYQWSLYHKIVLSLTFLVPLIGLIFLSLIIFQMDMNSPLLLSTILILFVAYISVLLIVLSFVLNLIFYIFLKYLFPHDNGIKGVVTSYKLQELSSYMSIPNQVVYLVLRIFYSIIYITFLIIVFGWIARITEKTSENNIIASIETWLVDSGLVSLGNTIGVLSIILTLLTITLPFSYRIINEAVTNLESGKDKN